MNIVLELPDELVEAIRRIIREELQTGPGSLHGGSNGFLNVDGAAEYLATTPAAVRALCKREQLPVHRTPQGRLLFDPTELNAYVRGEAA